MRIGARGKFIDFWSRAVTGPICFESDFDKRVYWPKLKKITEKWGIKYDPDHMVPCDDEMLDRLWQAAIDLVAEVGVLCTDTPVSYTHLISVQRAVRYSFVRVPGRTLPALQVKRTGTIIDKFYYNYMI